MDSSVVLLKNNDLTEYKEKIINTLSCYKERIINVDGSISYRDIKTTYFLENKKWTFDFFGKIEQFKKQYSEYRYTNRSFTFRSNNPYLNLEFRFITYYRLFNDEWKISSVLQEIGKRINWLSIFINEKYPNIDSILELDINQATIEWTQWLESRGYVTISKVLKPRIFGQQYYRKKAIVTTLNNFYNQLLNINNDIEEWEKDTWKIHNLKKYGFDHNKYNFNTLDFSSIRNSNIRNSIKKYFKQRLLSKNNFSLSTSNRYISVLTRFVNFILDMEPTWNDLNYLERLHIEKYSEHLNKSLVNKNCSIDTKCSTLIIVRKFLLDIQIKEYDIAPIKGVNKLIFYDDRPPRKKETYDLIKYIPDFVLEQLFKLINSLREEIQPIIWIMFKTGLRISDALYLKHNCLVKLNGKCWIVTDINKTNVKNHRIPIDDELANMIAMLISNSKMNSNDDNNPERFIFVRYNGKYKGRPYSKQWILDTLNLFALNHNITDENGNIYHFKNHAFRHTFAIKMLNGGADILTVQELLAHASPEMTMMYARLLDDKKRKAFDSVVSQGIFSFNENGKLDDESNNEIPDDILNMLWTDHKLTAIDNPYGSCRSRINGKCLNAKQPPCLTCNMGNPCKDLAVGISEMDISKYENHMKTANMMIETAKKYNRQEIVKENEELLKLYEKIYSTIKEGKIIYGRIDRMKK